MSRQRKILITGATRGIGAAIAQAMASDDTEFLLTGRDLKQVQALNATAAANVRYRAVDFADRAACAAFCEDLLREGPLDVCVNNAGINIVKPIDEVGDDDFDRLNDINYRAPYMICRVAAQLMAKQGRGRIVNVASIWSVSAKPNRTLYCAAKAGLAGLTRALALELAPHGVLVNSVSPGFVMTDLTAESLSESELSRLASQVPLGRFAQPSEIASVVRFLASESNSYLTGQNIVIDGGFTIV